MADDRNRPERPEDDGPTTESGRSEAAEGVGPPPPEVAGKAPAGPRKAPLPPERSAGDDQEAAADGTGPAARAAGSKDAAGAEETAGGEDAAGATSSGQGETEGEGEPAGAPSGGGERSGRQRLLASLWPPRINRNQLVVAVLLCVLGLGLAIQVRQTSEDSALRGARQEDLVRILDELGDRTTRLEDEKQRLEGQQSELENSSDQAEEARRQTQERERQLGVLAGTVAAEGPGIHFEIGDSTGAVSADKLLDAIQELRAAGAEAIQVNDVRVVADTYFSDTEGGVRIDGRRVTAPYRFDVIGRPQDLEPALNIPGGVVQTLQKEQATVTIEPSEKIVVDALRTAKRPDYARSSS